MLDLFQILANDGCGGLKPVVSIVYNVFKVIQILVPIGLILFGAIDLGKAVIANDDKEIKTAGGKLVKRAIAAVGVFLAVVIVNLVMGFIGSSEADGSDTTSWSTCWKSVSG